jgi:hypothetical protein
MITGGGGGEGGKEGDEDEGSAMVDLNSISIESNCPNQ